MPGTGVGHRPRKASSVKYQHSPPISAIDGVRNCLTSNLYAGSERPGTGRVIQRASSLGYAWDMTNARGEFEQHLSTIQQYTALGLSEADTRSHLIDPLLRILGFSDVRHLRREVVIPATKEFLDYELRVDDKPVMIVEAKAARHSLLERDAAQCVQYASVLGVRWCVITNGMTWVFYDSHVAGSLNDKWIAEVRLDGDELGVERAWAVLSAFSRESLVKPNPITSLLVERVVADELTRPDSKAVMGLRRSVQQRFGERVAGEAVLSAIRRVFLAPANAVAARVEDEPARDFEPLSASTPKSRRPPEEAGRPSRPRRGPRTESFTGRKVIAFTLRGERHEVKNWRGLLQGVCDIAAAEVGIARFQDLVIPIRGSTNSNFATDSKELRSPLPIQGGAVFVEGNKNANNAVRLVKRTVAATLGSDVELAIETAPLAGPE